MNIAFSSATEIAGAIRTRQISASEALDAHLAQIERHNAALNAVVIRDDAAARMRARAADAALARGELWGPLHGVPHTLKDAFATAGMRTTIGFPPLAQFVPSADATVVARLKNAGAVLIGKSNVATMLGDFQTGNPLFGRTNNPWNTERTPGGSSGGAAAALASGMTPFELGTDLAGSIRWPAHCCGVFGLKPTEHRVSLDGVVPDPRGTPRSVRIMSSVGPLARSVDDLALVYSLIAGSDGRDTDVPPVPLGLDAEPLALAGLRIAFAPNFPGLPIAAGMRSAVVDLAGELDRAGAIVDEARWPAFDLGAALASTGSLIGMAIGAFQNDGSDGGRPGPSLADYFSALHRRDAVIGVWERFFDDCDVLLCPVAMTNAFTHCEPGSALLVDGKPVDYHLVSAHTCLFNYSGHPALVMPYGLDDQKLPVGVQLVARRWDEARLLAVAAAISQRIGGFQRPPGY
jgi:amidase